MTVAECAVLADRHLVTSFANAGGARPLRPTILAGAASSIQPARFRTGGTDFGVVAPGPGGLYVSGTAIMCTERVGSVSYYPDSRVTVPRVDSSAGSPETTLSGESSPQ
jgi:hypothetical protein